MLKEMGPWELVVKWLDVMPMKLWGLLRYAMQENLKTIRRPIYISSNHLILNSQSLVHIFSSRSVPLNNAINIQQLLEYN